MTYDRGPYMNDDGDWWFPVDRWTWNEAQSEAADMARDSDGVARYIDKEKGVRCHDHVDWEDGDECCYRVAYHFVTAEPARYREASRAK